MGRWKHPKGAVPGVGPRSSISPQVPQFGTGFLVRAGTDLACSRFSLQVAPRQKSEERSRATTGSPKSRRLGLSVFMPNEDA
jgi:hypothetical protein